MGLTSSMYVALSGMSASMSSINTTAHNLANAETEGFVRQQTILETRGYLTKDYNSHVSVNQVGRGTRVAAVYQLRDEFIDKNYREEVGRKGFYEAQYKSVEEIENLLGELNGVAFQDSLEDLWVSIEELSKQPDSITARATLIETSVSFIERAESISQQLEAYQVNLNTQVQEKVDRINVIGAQIDELNTKIANYEGNGVEHANDLRDERNKLLDELATLVKITYKETGNGKVTVTVEETPFLTEDRLYKMETMSSIELEKRQNAAAGIANKDEEKKNTAIDLLVPVWPAYGYVEVFDLTRPSTSEMDTDIGTLKGVIVARGTNVGKYTDIPIRPDKETFKDENGVLDTKSYNDALELYDIETKEYLNTVGSSVIMSFQSKYDQLIHGIVTSINDLLCPNKEITLEDGSTITILDEDNAPVGIDEDATMGTELFTRKSVPRYVEKTVTYYDDDGQLVTGTVKQYNEEHANDNYSLYTLGELEVNQLMKENQSKIPLTENNGTGNYDVETCKKLVSAWQTKFASVSPDTVTEYDFLGYYTALVGNVATKGEELNEIAQSQGAMAENLNNQRLSVVGVSTDEELTNMIKFQHAYVASSRFFNVVNEMLAETASMLN